MYGAMSKNYLTVKVAQRCKIEAVNDKYQTLPKPSGKGFSVETIEVPVSREDLVFPL